LAILTKRNWKTFRKQSLPQTIFFAITIISVGLLILPLWNYAKFYAALYDFEYTIPAITINTSQLNENIAQINFTLIFTNPTGYSGLGATSVTCELEFYGDVHYVVTGRPPQYQATTLWDLTTVGAPNQQYMIGPNSVLKILFTTTINPNSTTGDQQDAYYDFISYLRTEVAMHGQIQWSLICAVTLTSFIGSIQSYETPTLATSVG
jgi:hypothetical protein